MKFKAAVLLIGLFCCFPSFADRYYVGVGSGYENTQFDYAPQELNGTVIVNSNNARGAGVLGELFGGYSHCFGNNVCSGFEINLFENSNRVARSEIITVNNNVTRTASFSHRARYGYGVSIKPGYYVSHNLLLFASLGYLHTRFQGTYNFRYNNNTPAIYSQYANLVNGYSFGGGAEYSINNYLSARITALYIRYKLYAVRDFADASFSPQFRLHNTQVLASLVYSFGDNFIS